MHAWESVQKAVDYIEDNINGEITLGKLVEVANLSYFNFHRLFTRLVKKPVQEYIKLCRLARSVDCLKNRESRIVDVALDYGFGSHEKYTRAFKDAYRFTPEAYGHVPIKSLNYH